ncbi:helix-turn-helix domain-containing protein [Spirosoma sp. KNUC1025]
MRDTAVRLFYIQGYHSTGINQFLAESAIAVATLYKHFSSNKDLLHAWA